MTRLTEDLLLLAHTDESRFIQREPIELEPLLDELRRERRADRRPPLRARRRTAPGILNADRDRVAQALRNLLRNAIEHTQPGGTDRARRPRAARAGASQIWVDDDGPGIAGRGARARLRPLPPRRLARARAPPAAPASASRSCARSSTPTAAASGRPSRRSAAPAS